MLKIRIDGYRRNICTHEKTWNGMAELFNLHKRSPMKMRRHLTYIQTSFENVNANVLETRRNFAGESTQIKLIAYINACKNAAL